MRTVFLCLTVFSLCAVPGVRGDDRAEQAAARASREASEESFRLLNGKLEGLIETQELLLKNQEKLSQRVASLAAELEEVKRSQSHLTGNTVSRDQLKDLVEKMQEIDRKRADDRELVLKGFKDLQKAAATPIAAPPPEARQPVPSLPEDFSGAYEYPVKSGDTLDLIVKAYNDKYKADGMGTITRSQVMALNPGLNPNKLFVGKKILIPKPPAKK